MPEKKILVIDQVKHMLGDGLREIVTEKFRRAGDLMVWGMVVCSFPNKLDVL